MALTYYSLVNKVRTASEPTTSYIKKTKSSCGRNTKSNKFSLLGKVFRLREYYKMKNLPLVVVIIVVVLEAHDLLVSGQSKEKSCRSVVQDLTKMQLGGISTCTKKMKFKNGKEKSKKQNCILRCVMQNVGILKDDGQVIEGEKIGEFISNFFPPSLVEQANRTFYPCIELGITTKFKTLEEDEFCNTYDPFIKCLMTNLPNLCPN